MEKQKKIVSMFDQIAKTYDISNRVLSFGVDKTWRKKACNMAFDIYQQKEIDLILDIACGTGDMMSFWEKQAETKKNSIKLKKVIGVDPSVEMVEVGRQKLPHLDFRIASATEIPFDSNSADILSISYGIRNVVEREDAIREFNRVLKPNGLLVILEFTKDRNQNFAGKMRDFYMNKILPRIGGFISKNREAYEYLPNSIGDFVTSEKLEKELSDNNFTVLENKGFSMGISRLFIARKNS
jgi:demethylmenaquinone methyltransferase/2-methoxy-6-polyprenyl-1,4-benzoquinol methylase